MIDQPTFSLTFAEHWMSQAYELACSAERRDEVPVGALLVLNGEIIGIGANCRERTHRTSAHAEISAIEDYSQRQGQWRVPPGTSLFVTTEPCLMCTGALLWARVDNIYYGCSDPRSAGLERVLPLVRNGIYDHRFREVRGGILAERCSKLISSYFRRKRKPADTTNAGVQT